MKQCLYSYAQLNDNTPPDDNTATAEHIVPYALGGSGAFVIDYCSKKANNDFGRDIDAPFLELPIVGFKRHELGLVGYGGNVPDMRFKGDCVELGTSCNVVFPYQRSPYADFGVAVVGGISTGAVSFAGSEDRLRSAIDGLIRKADKKGLTLLNQGLTPIFTTDEAIAAGQSSSGKTLHFRVDLGYENFFVPWSKGILKMALGLGALALGPTWAFSPEADVIRSCLVTAAAGLRASTLRGTTTARIPTEIATLLNLRAGEHTLAVLPHGHEMIAYISLFGGELLDAMINLGNGPADVKLVNDKMPGNWMCVFKIDPTTRQLTSMSLSDVEARCPPP